MSVGFQTSGDRLPSTLQEDDDMQNVLSLGVKLDPNLVKRVKENHKNTIGTLDLTNVPTAQQGIIEQFRGKGGVVRKAPSQRRRIF